MSPLPPPFARALARRATFYTPGTNCLRLLDASGDAFPDFFLDDYAGRWLAQTRTGALPTWLARLDLSRLALPANVPAPRSLYWKRLDNTDKQPPAHVAGEILSAPFPALENNLTYLIDFAAGYSQGLFLDQRDNRLRVHQRSRPGHDVLNLFAYTCGFSVAAAAGGARTVSVDLSRPALDWGRRNFDANRLDPAQHEFIAGEAAEWLKRLGKKSRTFDTIILDPPTFSRDKKGKIFRVERDFGALAAAAAALLKRGGAVLCTTNQRTLARPAFSSLILDRLAHPSAWKLTHAPMPPDFTGDPYLKIAWLTRR